MIYTLMRRALKYGRRKHSIPGQSILQYLKHAKIKDR